MFKQQRENFTATPKLEIKEVAKNIKRKTMQIAVDQSIDLALNENQYGVAPKIEEALKTIDIATISTYRKTPKFKSKLTALHNVDASNIYITVGAEDALRSIFANSYLKNNGSGNVLISDISWPYYTELAQNYLVSLNNFSLNEELYCYQFDVAEIIKAIHTHNPSVILLDSPHNPTGCQLEDDRIIEIYSAMNADRILVIDETYFEFSNRDDNRGELVQQLDNVVFIRSFSKYYGLAGLRIGYMLLGKGARAKLNLHDSYLGFNAIADEIACIALENRGFYTAIAAQLNQQKESLFNFLRDIEQIVPYQSSANFLLVKFGKQNPLCATHYVEFMARHGIQLKLYSQGKLANSVRITIGTPEQMRYLKRLSNEYLQLHQLFNMEAYCSLACPLTA